MCSKEDRKVELVFNNVVDDEKEEGVSDDDDEGDDDEVDGDEGGDVMDGDEVDDDEVDGDEGGDVVDGDEVEDNNDEVVDSNDEVVDGDDEEGKVGLPSCDAVDDGEGALGMEALLHVEAYALQAGNIHVGVADPAAGTDDHPLAWSDLLV